MRLDLPYELDKRPVSAVVISSQLVYGSVGNIVISRLIERAGYRAVSVPTVMFSNLPHYSSLAGGAVDNAWLSGMLDDLLERDVLREAAYVCVGYLAHPDQALIVGQWFTRALEANPELQLIVDPAMGDDDVGLYTAPEVVDGYIQHLIPLASGVTPNNFELGLLTEGNIKKSLVDKVQSLLTPTLRWVAVTSAANSGPHASTVDTLLVTSQGSTLVKTPAVESRAKGAGDFFLGTTVGSLLGNNTLEDSVALAATATAKALAGSDAYFSPTT